MSASLIKRNVLFLASLLFLTITCQAGQISDTGVGYSVELPSNWVRTVRNDTHHVFKDTSFTYQSTVSIRRHPIGADFSDGEDWVRMNYIAYLLAVEYSVLPYGTTIYSDSSAARSKQGHWAPEAWSLFFTVDSVPNYSEFIVYSESNGFGYEMYAIGDSTDMEQNISFYVALLDTIQFINVTSLAHFVTKNLPADRRRLHGSGVEVCDLLGRKLSISSRENKRVPGGIYFRKEQKIFNVNGHNN